MRLSGLLPLPGRKTAPVSQEARLNTKVLLVQSPGTAASSSSQGPPMGGQQHLAASGSGSPAGSAPSNLQASSTRTSNRDRLKFAPIKPPAASAGSDLTTSAGMAAGTKAAGTSKSLQVTGTKRKKYVSYPVSLLLCYHCIVANNIPCLAFPVTIQYKVSLQNAKYLDNHSNGLVECCR